MKEFDTPMDDDLEENLDDDELEDEDDDVESASFVCEDCDYRWEDTYSGEDYDERLIVCPMCGSVNVTQL